MSQSTPNPQIRAGKMTLAIGAMMEFTSLAASSVCAGLSKPIPITEWHIDTFWGSFNITAALLIGIGLAQWAIAGLCCEGNSGENESQTQLPHPAFGDLLPQAGERI